MTDTAVNLGDGQRAEVELIVAEVKVLRVWALGDYQYVNVLNYNQYTS